MSVRLLLPIALLGAAPPKVAPPAPAPMHPWVAACTNDDGWDKPGPPFRIFGNSYYVGTCGIASILVTSPKGHILIDAGTDKGADVVLANIRSLGFKPAQVAILLSSHEHFDHVGGLAKLQQATGARVFASRAAAAVLASGEDAPADPQFGMHPAMRPVARVSVIEQGQKVRYNRDGLVLTPIFTPGHTPGATSWQWRSCEGAVCKTIVYADSLSAVSRDDYRFADHPDYLAAFRKSIETIATLDCDILLAPHPSAGSMRERLQMNATLGAGFGKPCQDYARTKRAGLLLRLGKEGARGR